MDPKKRVVLSLPIRELWSDSGPVTATRTRRLSTEDIRTALREAPVRFVVADVGHPLVWVPPESCFDFWKTEVLPRVAEPSERCFLDEFPGSYAYHASFWDDGGADPIVVLEKSH